MTDFPLGHALAIQRWSTSLAVEALKKSYFAKFIGKGNKSMIIQKDELHKGKGEKVTVGLRMKLNRPGVEGDNVIEGHADGEEAMHFFDDYLFIDQLRKSTKSKGKMSEQRVPYNIRANGRDALADWWAETMDENMFSYLSGARGVDTSFKVPIGWTGRANNTLQAPDAAHQIYAGDATSSADLDAADQLALIDVERLMAIAKTLDPMIQPLKYKGQSKFILLMHVFQAFHLRTSTTTNDWLDITKSVQRGKSALMYKDSLGEYAGVILHSHRNVIQFDDYGAGANVDAARALFLGAQAGMIAYGKDGGKNRYSWNEEKDDRGNALAITAGTIFGTKKCRYDGADFGVISVDANNDSPA